VAFSGYVVTPRDAWRIGAVAADQLQSLAGFELYSINDCGPAEKLSGQLVSSRGRCGDVPLKRETELKEEKTESPKSHQPRVKVMRDGPYLVSGGVPLADQTICVDDYGQPRGWKEGRKYPARESYALCRCGRSESMPYCDGNHVRVEFDGTETATDTPYLDQAELFEGPGVKLTDAEGFCVGAGFCDRAGGAWALTRRSGDPAAKQAVIEEACDCPSGRLVAWDEDDQAIEPEFEPSIGLVEETRATEVGPIWVRGGIPVESSNGTTYEVRNRVTLCRCGRSSNKPFCDGSHRR
jgi:CDGSH-type Zn-finger protein